ncbi:RimK family alpha-L-glutamate ligase [bacterium]|nr:RimK family alpha-L-glutamate ligase [bacterium]
MAKTKVVVLGSISRWEKNQWKKTAQKLGVELVTVRMEDVVLRIDQKRGVRVQFWSYSRQEKKMIRRDFAEFDILLRRWIKKYYIPSLVVSWYMKRQGKVVLNSRLEMMLDKVSQAIRLYEAGLPHPLTWQALRPRNVKILLRQVNYPIIIKEISGAKGKQVFKATSFSSALKFFRKKKIQDLLIQEDLKVKEDIRVFVVGDKCLGAMKRIAPPGDFRSNVSVGAKTEPVELTPELKKLALGAARAMGYEICGVDIMYQNGKPYVLEVNRMPGFKGFSKTLGIPVAEEILRFALKLHRAKTKSA